jgi:hypothetical protein
MGLLLFALLREHRCGDFSLRGAFGSTPRVKKLKKSTPITTNP